MTLAPILQKDDAGRQHASQFPEEFSLYHGKFENVPFTTLFFLF